MSSSFIRQLHKRGIKSYSGLKKQTNSFSFPHLTVCVLKSDLVHSCYVIYLLNKQVFILIHDCYCATAGGWQEASMTQRKTNMWRTRKRVTTHRLKHPLNITDHSRQD